MLVVLHPAYINEIKNLPGYCGEDRDKDGKCLGRSGKKLIDGNGQARGKMNVLSSSRTKHRCNLSAHARVLSLIEGKWRILKELCCLGFQEDKRCLFFSDCSLIIWKRQRRVVCFWRLRIISVNRLQTP